MPDFSLLSPMMQKMHGEFVRMYFIMLPVFFAFAIVLQWFKSANGAFDFFGVLKRAMVSTVLLVAFPEISQAIVLITDGIANQIDQLNSLQSILDMASQKIETYTFSAKDMLLMFDDLFLSLLTFMSYWFLLFARYLNVVMYNFFWIFLIVISPLLLLFNLFEGTSNITANLFKSMVEVASWKIVWAILGAMLTSLSFGKMYLVEGSYITLTLMNFVIGLAMILTPLVVRSLVGKGITHATSAIGPVAAFATITPMTRIAKPAASAVAGAKSASNQSKRRKK